MGKKKIPKAEQKEATSKEKKTAKAKEEAIPEEAVAQQPYVPRLKAFFQEEVMPGMMRRFKYRNRMEVPRVKKIVINMGVGQAVQEPRELEQAIEELALIAGQRPHVCKARKSISAFKVRQGMQIGCSVTLHGNGLYEFLDRLVNIAIPRIRDFRGLNPNSFDGRGNYNLGIREHTIFVELDYSKVSRIRGMDVAIVTSARTDEECKELLSLFGMPFREK